MGKNARRLSAADPMQSPARETLSVEQPVLRGAGARRVSRASPDVRANAPKRPAPDPVFPGFFAVQTGNVEQAVFSRKVLF